MSVVRTAALNICAAKDDLLPVFQQQQTRLVDSLHDQSRPSSGQRPYWFHFAGDQIIAAKMLSAVNLDRNRRPNILTLDCSSYIRMCAK